ncbi:MAG: HTTM domain-containing protein [Candidatus Eremiobacteraeota bacterium]|nr:HTTM domain-containing protein [Candidatus Eremiobacteraeota bacterium]
MGRSLIKRWLQGMALDLRSLALMRIAYATCLLQDLAIRASDLTAHYTDWGAQPGFVVTKLSWDPAFFSLHLMQTSREGQALLFLVTAFAYLCLLVGYRTRLAGWVSWFLLVSLQNRNPIILDGGDLYLRCLLFWLLFCPLGARWSVDAARRPSRPDEPETVLHLGTLAYCVQLSLIYGWAWALKSGAEWRIHGTAVQQALRIDGIASPPAQWLLQHPDWMRMLNFSVLYFEGLVPILLWIHPATRLLAVLGVTAMHLGMSSFLHLGAFTLIAATSTWGLIPSFFWRRLKLSIPRPNWRWPLAGGDRDVPGAPGLFAGIMLVFLMLRVMYCNYWWGQHWTPMPRSPDLRLFRLDQQWNMFAPRPVVDDGYYVVVAETAEGDWMNAWIVGGRELSWDKPARVASQYPNARWRKLMMNLCQKEHKAWRKPLMEYLFSRIAGARALRLYYVGERTRPDGGEEPLIVQDLGYYSPRELEPSLAPTGYATLASGREVLNLALQDAH